MTIHDEAREAIRAWKADPVLMVRQLFKVEPDHWQAEALREWADPSKTRKRVALQACAGPGKSTALAWCGWNGMLCYSDGINHPNGAAVSITGDNLRNNLWKELAVWRERSPVLQKAFEMTSETIFERAHPKTWILGFRSFAKSADAEAQGRTLSGLHAKSIFYLVDESGDMPPAVGRAADQGLSNCEWGRIFQAGNPTSHSGMLYVSVGEQAHRWTVIRITGDPDDPNRSPRIDLEEAAASIELYGRENPWVMAYVLGQFPPSSLNALLGPDQIRDAMKRHLRVDEYNYAQKRLGIDPARFGGDKTVIFPRQGLAAFKPVAMRNARGPEIAARVVLAKSKWGSEMELIDSTGGYGATVEDSCLLAGVPLIPINFSGAADDPRYYNKRSEMYFRASEHVKNGGALPNVPILVRQGSAATYYLDKGRLRVLEKDQMKKALGGESPDEWDAFVVTFAIADMPSQMAQMTGQFGNGESAHAKTEWDPHAEERP